ncbi:hypothetical protein ACWGDT_16105 [Streptomyces avermitilis]
MCASHPSTSFCMYDPARRVSSSRTAPSASRGSVRSSAQLAQRLELIGPGGDPLGFAQFGFPGRGSRGFGGELLLDNDNGAGVVHGARRGGRERLVDPFPLRELRAAALIVGQVLVPGVLPRVEPGVLQGRRDVGRRHAVRVATNDTSADAGWADRFVRRGHTRGERAADTAPGRPGRIHQGLAFVVPNWRRPAKCVNRGSVVVTGVAG